VGAGIAGLSAAKLLSNNHNVTVFEKGRSVGGRMSHRVYESYDFDHGAQYFKICDKRFCEFLYKNCAKSTFMHWVARFASIDQGEIINSRCWGKSNFVGVPSMNSLLKDLSIGLNIYLNTKINNLIWKKNKWELEIKQNKKIRSFDFVIITAPAPQAKELIPDNCLFKKEIEKKLMKSCFTLMLGFEDNPIKNFDAAFVKDKIISWISVNNSKPLRATKPSIVINSTNSWADKHIDNDLRYVTQKMKNKLEEILNSKINPVYSDLHRWRYANIESQNGPKFYYDSKLNLAACGDWCIKGRVESAFISALSLYDMINHI